MKQQRTHQQGITGLGCANYFRMGFTASGDALGIQSAYAMRAGQHTKRAIVRIGIIKVQTHSEHLLQQIHGRLHMRYPVLHTPGAESKHLHTFCDR
jgi:hypothetical protein